MRDAGVVLVAAYGLPVKPEPETDNTCFHVQRRRGDTQSGSDTRPIPSAADRM